METHIEPAVRKVQGYVDGFFWILPNPGVAAVVFALFLAIAWAGKRGVIGLFQRHGRDDLGRLLGGFAKWGSVLFGVLVVTTIVFPSVEPRRGRRPGRQRASWPRLRSSGCARPGPAAAPESIQKG